MRAPAVYGRAFDAVLVRPLGALMQLLAMDVAARRVGRVVIGVALLGAAAAHAGLVLTPPRLALLVVAPVAGALIFSALFVATATVTFWWVESGELGNALTYGGHDFSGYPITVYGALFRRLFAYGLGFAFVAYYPALVLLGRDDPLGAPAALGYGCPLIAAVAPSRPGGASWRAGRPALPENVGRDASSRRSGEARRSAISGRTARASRPP